MGSQLIRLTSYSSSQIGLSSSTVTAAVPKFTSSTIQGSTIFRNWKKKKHKTSTFITQKMQKLRRVSKISTFQKMYDKIPPTFVLQILMKIQSVS